MLWTSSFLPTPTAAATSYKSGARTAIFLSETASWKNSHRAVSWTIRHRAAALYCTIAAAGEQPTSEACSRATHHWGHRLILMLCVLSVTISITHKQVIIIIVLVCMYIILMYRYTLILAQTQWTFSFNSNRLVRMLCNLQGMYVEILVIIA